VSLKTAPGIDKNGIKVGAVNKTTDPGMLMSSMGAE